MHLRDSHTGGKPPIGYDYDSKLQEYLVNEHEASSVKLIFEMYASGAGYNTILNELSHLEFRTKNGNTFNKIALPPSSEMRNTEAFISLTAVRKKLLASGTTGKVKVMIKSFEKKMECLGL